MILLAFVLLLVCGAFVWAWAEHADIRRREFRRLRNEVRAHTDLQARLVYLCIQNAQVDPTFPSIVLDEIAHARKERP